MVDVAPSILVPKGYRARMDLAVAFQQYFDNYVAAQAQSSAMVRARYSANTRYGLTILNQARLEVGTLLGILANTIPSVFYMLVHIYSDPELLSDIRKEIQIAGFIGTSMDIAQNCKILAMQETCPLLHSTFQELLRVHARGSSARYVREDVMLDGKYLLRKGMVVQIPMAVMHGSVASWGPDVKGFNARRFLKQKRVINGFKQNPTAYRPFGGGAALCPGRHFVTLESMLLAACMVSSYDLVPVDGPWNIPSQKQESLATNVFPPANDIRVKTVPRRLSGV